MLRPPIFYKYTTSNTALLILENMRLRWSSPLLFNDVAEFQRMPCFEPTVAYAHKLLPDVIASAVFDGTCLDEARLGTPMKILLHLVKHLVKHGTNRQAVLDMLALDGSGADDRIEAGLRAHFQALDLTKARIFCVTTEPDNEPMWGNYAEAHAGCVLGFRHIEKLSTPLLEARPINYSQHKPIVGSGLDFLLYGDSNELRSRTLDAVCFTKKAAWSHEKEWRVLTWRPKEQEQYGDYLFHAEELESITLGSRASQSFEAKVRDLSATRYPFTVIYRMQSQYGDLKRSEISTFNRHP